MASPIVTLTADWGVGDFFAGMVKGRLMRSIADVRIVDISLGIEPYDIRQALFVVANSYRQFPQGTIHIIDVNSHENASRKHIVMLCNGHYFIANDNGILGALAAGGDAQVVDINTGTDERGSSNFAAFDYYCDAAALLARGMPVAELGAPHGSLLVCMLPNPLFTGNELSASIIHIDSYGNAYLNITLGQFEAFRAGRRFRARIKDSIIEKIQPTFSAEGTRGISLMVSNTGYLMLSMFQRGAGSLFGLNTGDPVRFQFLETI
ncbi:MAG: SAM-dependent chlorinase/fluorinase [Bacteroidales bacterium]|nr:SAM-dependent chlorinase/fluorinase [Bacteroidales bacterium]